MCFIKTGVSGQVSLEYISYQGECEHQLSPVSSTGRLPVISLSLTRFCNSGMGEEGENACDQETKRNLPPWAGVNGTTSQLWRDGTPGGLEKSSTSPAPTVNPIPGRLLHRSAAAPTDIFSFCFICFFCFFFIVLLIPWAREAEK